MIKDSSKIEILKRLIDHLEEKGGIKNCNHGIEFYQIIERSVIHVDNSERQDLGNSNLTSTHSMSMPINVNNPISSFNYSIVFSQFV